MMLMMLRVRVNLNSNHDDKVTGLVFRFKLRDYKECVHSNWPSIFKCLGKFGGHEIYV